MTKESAFSISFSTSSICFEYTKAGRERHETIAESRKRQKWDTDD